MGKLSFKEFSNKINYWYNETRPASAKPRPHIMSSFYDMYLDGQDFKFL